MAYNYYPTYTNPYMNYQQYPNPMQMQQQMPQQQQTPQIQNGGFISVRGEAEARNYPVAPGNSVTFKDETAPYVYTKTMGFSQLDTPTFDKYRLVKEDVAVSDAVAQEAAENVAQQKIQQEIEKLWAEVNALKNAEFSITKTKKKETVKEDE